jgi:uncharacterized membrane protein YraQ (UPF0718 family)/copper chaperone CopZ
MIASIWDILQELAPWLFVGAVVGGALEYFLPGDFLRRHLTGRWGVVKAAALGVPMPLCSCAVIPTGLSLKKQGASDGATVAFMIATPQTGADSITVAAGFLGWPFALFTLASTFVLGLVGGWWADRGGARPTDGAGDGAAGVGCADEHDDHVGGGRRGWRQVLDHAVMLLRSIWVWLVVGVVASAAIEQFVPAGALEKLGAGGGLPAMLVALVIGMPLYVCTTGSIPIAAALIHSGFPPGAAMVFLISGPATNVATMGAIYRVLGGRTLWKYLTTIAVGSVAFGVLFDLLVESSSAAVVHQHEHHAWWAAACAAALVALLAWFAAEDLRAWLRARRTTGALPAAAAAATRTVEVSVRGMTCGSCVSRLERVLRGADGVSEVEVSLEPGRAVVRGDVSDAQVRELIESTGFRAG